MKKSIPLISPRGMFRRRETGRAVRRALLSGSATLLLGVQVGGSLSAAEFPPVFRLSNLDGANGFVINGIGTYMTRSSGYSVSDAGDVNGDGVDDLLIGAPFAYGGGRRRFAGESYVVFGGGVGSTGALELSDLNGTNGFVVNGVERDDLSGRSVSSAGDVNGDGVDDLSIGAYGASPNGNSGAGASYVVFGGGGVGGGGELNLSDLNGADGFVINGADRFYGSGRSVSGAGDVNGDGVDDLLIGTSFYSPRGESGVGASYVVFGGGEVGRDGVFELSGLDGANGFVINGVEPGDKSGLAVSGAGDVNGDGVDDLLIGAPEVSPGGRTEAGASYVVFGGSGVGSTGVLELSDLDGADGFVINGVGPGGQVGRSVSGAGDVNDDGVDDLLIGASTVSPDGSANAGVSYVVFGGGEVGRSGVFSLWNLDGTDGFVINGVDPGDYAGFSVSGAGDVNGDGVGDLLIGARGARRGVGESYLIFGGRGVGGAGVLELSDLEGAGGTVFRGIGPRDNLGGDQSGWSVSGAGDVNGDGVDDLLIGAPDANRESTGETYVVFGVAAGRQTLCNGLPVTVDLNRGETPTSGDDVILGTPADDTINALGGNDTVCGMGGADIINAGRGDDWVEGGPGDDIIRGGAGDDELRGQAGDDWIMGNLGVDRILGGAGVDEIDGGAGGDILLPGPGATAGSGFVVKGGGGHDVVYGGPDADDIRGNAGDDRLFGRGGSDRINGGPDEDWIAGDAGDDVLNGGMGDDVVQGGAGDDRVRGDLGDDVVLGGKGRDIVEGGGGDDVLVGGASSGDVCRGQGGIDIATSSCERTFGVP